MIKKLAQLIRTYKPQAIVVVCVLLLVSFIPAVHAGWFVEDIMSGISSLIGSAIGAIMQMIMMLLGLLLSMMINVVIWVAQYTKFSDAKAVTAGWVIVRDLANMALVISLLYNAFKAVFNTESDYNITSHLGKIVVAAILVNFSKMITLVLVDISQVIMMSFVNAFADIGPGNLYKILNIESYLRITSASAGGLGAAAGGMIAATFLMVVSLGVLIGMAAVLVVRIVVIWFMIVISPIAMVASATKINQLGGIAKKYWSTLSQWLTLGPMMAFVIWLTFTSMSTFGKEDNVVPPGASFSQGVAGLGNAFGAEAFMGYVFSIAMMVYGIKFAIEASGAAGGVFSKAYGLASKRLGIPEASVSGATNFFRNRFGNAADLTLASARVAAKQAQKYEKAGTAGFGTTMLKKYAGGVGKVAVGTKVAVNTLKHGSLSGVVGAGYRQLVKDEKGAVGDELHHMNEHEVEGHQERFEKLGNNALLGEVAHIKNGTRPEMTGMEGVAIMREAQKRGLLKDIDQINELQEKLMGMSGDGHFKEEEIGKIREKALPEGSIQKINEFTLDENGKQVPNLGRSLAKIADNASGYTHLNMAQNVKLKTDHKKDWRRKGETGVDPSNQAYQRSKAELLGLNAQALAQAPEEFKENIKDYLMGMLEQGFDNDGKSILSDAERSKIEQLLGATQADGQAIKNANSQEKVDKLLQDGVSSFTNKHADYVTNRDKHTDPAHTPSVDGRREKAVNAVDKLRHASNRLKELTELQANATATSPMNPADLAELNGGIDLATGLRFRSEVDAENDIAKLIKGEDIEGIDIGDLTKEELALYAGSHALVENQNSGRARRAAEREAQKKSNREREVAATTAKNVIRQALQNQINSIAQLATNESDVHTAMKSLTIDTSDFTAKEITSMIASAMKAKQQRASQQTKQTENDWRNIGMAESKRIIDEAIFTAPSSWSADQVLEDIQKSGAVIANQNLIAFRDEIQRKLDQQRRKNNRP